MLCGDAAMAQRKVYRLGLGVCLKHSRLFIHHFVLSRYFQIRSYSLGSPFFASEFRLCWTGFFARRGLMVSSLRNHFDALDVSN
jgi:hypothetical protein